MSRSGVRAESEGIDGIGRRGGTDIGFQAVAAYDVNGAVEQAGNVLLQAHIVVNRDAGVGINLNHDVGVAVGAVVAARARTEQRGMRHTARAQSALVLPQPLKDFLPVHDELYTTNWPCRDRENCLSFCPYDLHHPNS